jgi:hypothetical protein
MCGPGGPHYSRSGDRRYFSGEYALNVEEERYRHRDTHGDQYERYDGDDLDFLPEGLQSLEQFLLLERVPVGGFADHLQLIFNPLERIVLLHDLIAQSLVLRPQIGQTVFDRLKVKLC